MHNDTERKLTALCKAPIKDPETLYYLVRRYMSVKDTLAYFRNDESAIELIDKKISREILKLSEAEQNRFRQDYQIASILEKMDKRGLPIDVNALRLCCNNAFEAYCDAYQYLNTICKERGFELQDNFFRSNRTFTGNNVPLNIPLGEARKLWKHTTILDMDKLASYIKHLSDGSDRLYCKWVNNASVTGRIQTVQPNIQGFPKAVRKACFKPSAGNVLISGDYESEELVIMAIIADDKQLLHDILSGTDLHRIVAADLYKKQPEAVTEEERSTAKRISFATLYGAGCSALEGMAKSGRCKQYDGSIIANIVKARYPAINVLEKKIEREGVIRYIDGSTIDIRDVLKKYSRVNRLIQTSASIILKEVVLELDRFLPADASIVCLIHDEIIVECPENLSHVCKDILEKTMSQVNKKFGKSYELPVKVEVTKGDKNEKIRNNESDCK